MAAIKINTIELYEVLKTTPTHHNIMLVGKHGIGKSQIITHYFTEKRRKVVTLFLGQMSDPGDLIGLPVLDSTTNKTDFRPPYWFPENDGPIVLFLDELNRARPEILQCVMDLTLNKTLAGKHLPTGSQIIVAVNDGDEYQLTDLDPALVSRFNVYYFSPTPQEWLLWAAENHLDRRVIDFIDKNRDYLDAETHEYQGLDRNPDRRSWQRVSEIISDMEEITRTTEKIVAGIVGIATASKFIHFVKANDTLNIREIFSDFGKHKAKIGKMQTHELSLLNERLFRMLETEDKQDDVKRFVQNTEEYIKWLNTQHKNEVLAHWTTLYDSDTYPKTKIAILMYSPFIYSNIVEFIKKITL
jgi:MoxR-like ATPase